MGSRKIFFRADASSAIGYGHFIRTLALADMLKDDFDCTFFTVSPTPYQMSEMEKVCAWKALPQETAFRDFLEILQGDEIVVLDNYFYSTEYQQQVKNKGCMLVCIDDIHDKHYVADVVINHSLSNTDLFDVEPYTKLCLGFDYALLRRPFLEAIKQSHYQKQKTVIISICCGGSDYYDMTGKCIETLLKNYPSIFITAIVGDAYQPKKGKVINDRVRYLSRLSAQEMADLFLQSDWVICSASTTCIEALACGANVAAGWYVDNQADFYAEIVNKGLVYPLGHLEKDNEIHINLPHSQNNTLKLSVDIKSTIVKLFGELPDDEYLRDARKQDVDLIFEWANDSTVRSFSFNSEPIPYENHIKWFARLLDSDCAKMYIMIKDGVPVGQIRISIIGDEAEIGYSIAKESRGKGYGTRIVKLLESECRGNGSLKRLVARVKSVNELSSKIFVSNGYKQISCEDNVITFIKEL